MSLTGSRSGVEEADSNAIGYENSSRNRLTLESLVMRCRVGRTLAVAGWELSGPVTGRVM